MLTSLVGSSAAADPPAGCTTTAEVTTCVFAYTGKAETWTVPARVRQATVDLYGAAGGSVAADGSVRETSGGLGGHASADLALTPGETVTVVVGGRGGSTGTFGSPGAGGFNGGAAGGSGTHPAAGGGGASDIRIDGSDLAHRKLVAGGGGGASFGGAKGGAGGGLTGTNGDGTNGGAGGDQTGPNDRFGVGSTGANGGFGSTGATNMGGGGGGGGFYGGAGGGLRGGGGGGSGFGPAGVTFGTDGRSGDGLVTISYTEDETPPDATGQLEAVANDLQAVIAENTGTSPADKAEDALAKLHSALAKLGHTPPDRQGALGDIEGAVGDLEAAVKDGRFAEGVDLMERLAGAARLLAEEAIADAEARGGAADKIAEAEQALADGDAKLTSEQFKDAVAKYKDAVSKAEGAGTGLKPKPSCTAGSDNFSDDTASSQPTTFAGGTIDGPYTGPAGGIRIQTSVKWFGEFAEGTHLLYTGPTTGPFGLSFTNAVSSVQLDAQSTNKLVLTLTLKAYDASNVVVETGAVTTDGVGTLSVTSATNNIKYFTIQTSDSEGRGLGFTNIVWRCAA